MLTVSAPDATEIRCNAVFEALMWALARPGERHEMTEAGMAPVIETLIDRECTGYTDDPALGRLIQSSGAKLGPAALADHLFLRSPADSLALLSAVRCGSALYPDDGATIVAEVPHGHGQRLRLSGPGIENERLVEVALPGQFWARRAQLCLYPEGFDLLLIDGPWVIGIPRSTQIEVL